MDPSLLLAGGTQALKMIGGGIQLLGAAKKRRRAQRAAQEADDYANESLAKIEATPETGLPKEQYNLATQNINRNLGGGIRSLQNLGGGSAIRGITNLVQATNDATGKLDVQNAITKLNNIKAKRQAILNQRNMINNMKYQRANEMASAASAQQGAGLSNLFGGASDAASAYIMANGSNNFYNPSNNQYNLNDLTRFRMPSGVPSEIPSF